MSEEEKKRLPLSEMINYKLMDSISLKSQHEYTITTER
jgi:hypothetical protein